MFTQPYAPTPKTKKRLSASTTSGGTAVLIGNFYGTTQVRVRSLSANTVDCYFAFGNDATVTCDATKDEGTAPGQCEILTINGNGPVYCAVVTESGTATLEIGAGSGG